ncbi:MAG TPA: hypothetical protein VMD07_01205 [Candidatus Acidoferrales bacterium]|nr:hypothetical protein [Candidatus Acidoferrales bacterium]
MSDFRLDLVSEERHESIDRIVSFIGADESGSFGILANRESLITILSWGLCRFTTADGATEYVGMPGGVLSFGERLLRIATPRYVRAAESETLLRQLDDRMKTEEEDRRRLREVLHNLDREFLRRLAQPL